jgi:dimethylamine monooxygenase subunit A
MTSAPPYRPYVGGAFRWRLGLRPLDLADWIEFGDDADVQLAEKARVCAQHHDTAFAVIDGIEPEATEVFDALVDHLWQWCPDRAEAVASLPSGLHPLDAAGRLVQEDLALLVERDGQLVFGGGSICFPNRWDLRSKLGRSMAEVHAPVARLNDQLAEPIDRFFERLTPERSFWRLGWGVIDTDELYQPLDGTAGARPQAPAPHELHLRVERETLRRFEATRCVLFTIRTHLSPITAVRADAAEALRLAEAIEAFPLDVAEYKQLDDLGSEVVRWLRQS